MKNKKIIAALLSVFIILGSLFSLSSCLYGLEFILGATVGQGSQTPGEGSGGSEDTGTSGGQGGTQGGSGEQNGDDGASGGSGDTTPDTGGEDSSDTPVTPTQKDDFLPDRDKEQEKADALEGKTRTLLSTVRIASKFTVSNVMDMDGYFSPTYPDTVAGSGIIYKISRESGDAYIITNYHVVYHKNATNSSRISEDIKIYLYGMEAEEYAIPATYVGGSLTYDIAVLKVSQSDVLKNSAALAVDLGDSNAARVFDDVIVVGNPEGDGISATEGIISVVSESLAMTAADGKTSLALRVMRISAAVNSGNSGGGLYDKDGALIGIVNAKLTGSDIDNMAYAIPISLAKNIADSIIHYCDNKSETSFYRAILGVTLGTEASGTYIDPENGKIEIIERVNISSLTDTCIIKDKVAVGDVIESITVDGVKIEVTRTHHVIDHMMTARVGSTVSMDIVRGDKKVTVTFEIPESALTKVA